MFVYASKKAELKMKPFCRTDSLDGSDTKRVTWTVIHLTAAEKEHRAHRRVTEEVLQKESHSYI